MTVLADNYFERWGREVLSYDEATGVFTCLTPPSHLFSGSRERKIWLTRFAGKPAGVNRAGYLDFRFRGHLVLLHRYALFLSLGRWPILTDHINGDPFDNRIVNLREADESTNRMNQSLRSDNKSGVIGVHRRAGSSRWTAAICARGRREHLGSFATRDEAAAARHAAQSRLGFSPNHGRERRLGRAGART